jgi:hypothetical protein
MNDLLTVYLAGDASADTRTLVEDFARRQPEFAARLKAASALVIPAASTLPAPGIGEVHALRRTRQYLFVRTMFLAWAIVFTLLPLAFTFGSEGTRIVFWGSHPGLVLAFWSLAGASWVAWTVIQRQVRQVGL